MVAGGSGESLRSRHRWRSQRRAWSLSRSAVALVAADLMLMCLAAPDLRAEPTEPRARPDGETEVAPPPPRAPRGPAVNEVGGGGVLVSVGFQFVFLLGPGAGADARGAIGVGRFGQVGLRTGVWTASWKLFPSVGAIDAGVVQLFGRWFPGGGSAYLEAALGGIAYRSFYASEHVAGRTTRALLPGGHVGVGFASPWPADVRPAVGIACETAVWRPVSFTFTFAIEIATKRRRA